MPAPKTPDAQATWGVDAADKTVYSINIIYQSTATLTQAVFQRILDQGAILIGLGTGNESSYGNSPD